MKKLALLFIAFITVTSSYAQIVSIEPAIFNMDDEITVTYDATQGNSGLVSVTPVYAHTGVVTESGGPSNWQYVQGNWGTADSKMEMTPIGDNKHQLTFVPREFYGLPTTVQVNQLAFVFRNVDGSKEGKTASLGDIFVDVPDPNVFSINIISPDQDQSLLSLNENINIRAIISQEANYTLTDNGNELTSGSGTTLDYEYTATTTGNHSIVLTAEKDGQTITDEITIVVLDENPNVADPPFPVKYGATLVGEDGLIVALYAPEKENVFLLSSVTDFRIDADYQMNKSTNGEYWWIELDNLNPEDIFLYQYLVDGTIKIADPFSTLILDPYNDEYIDEALNAVPAPYPTGLTSGHISVVDLSPEVYDWQVDDFTPPEDEDLVIYEILMRDFLADHSFESLIDTLSYLKKLGVNAIELMPVSEFENNNSWGYNPSYHMALDKYYGSPTSFKRLVDEAHKMGIAVLLDIVYNHAFGQSPLVRMYWDGSLNQPAANSPYFNGVAKHPYNVGFDFNHESQATKTYTKQTIDYWLSEYRIDGFRFDLSKGFTQNFSSGDSGFSAYDQSRINILRDYGQHIWDQYPDNILILEHFATNSEEKELSDLGFLLWGNANYSTNEATMGWHDGNKSNFGHVYFENRGWSDPHLIGFMESHDEERLMFKNEQFGNNSGSYNVKDKRTGLRRNAAAAAMFFAIPGPKMIWQFGELGYDFSINRCEDGSISENCRLSPKPIRWDYLDDADRKALFDVYSQMLKLKTIHPAIDVDADVSLSLSSSVKTMQLSKGDDHITIVANFDVEPRDVNIDLQSTGEWYDYITGEVFNYADDSSYDATLAPGEFHVLINNKEYLTKALLVIDYFPIIYPNPTSDRLFITLPEAENVTVDIFALDGRLIKSHILRNPNAVLREIDITGIDNGTYVASFRVGDFHVKSEKIVISR